MLATSFAVFLRELLLDLPHPDSSEARQIADMLLQHRDAETGLFSLDPGSAGTGQQHDRDYLNLQQTHFAQQALRLLGTGQDLDMPFMERWPDRRALHAWFDSLDWSNPWRESNNVMFALYFFEHARWAGIPGPWQQRIEDGLDWLDERQDRASGLWGKDPTRSVYNAIYGAYHFLFFYLHWRGSMPQADRILAWTRGLQTSEGFFAHTLGGGACEDYDCVDLLIKLGGDEDHDTLLRCARAVLASRDSVGGFCWARGQQNGPAFLVGNWMRGLSLRENRKLLLARLRSLLPQGRRWRYSGLRSLECPMEEADIWSSWFRVLILAEIDDKVLHSGARWGFRAFPSLGWHGRRKVDRA